MECDELWSFVGTKAHQQWIWLAIDRNTREIVGVAVGKRDPATAQQSLRHALCAVHLALSLNTGINA